MANFCNKCGNKLAPDSMFCDNCGNKINTIYTNTFSNQVIANPNPFSNSYPRPNNPFNDLPSSTKANLPNWEPPQQNNQQKHQQHKTSITSFKSNSEDYNDFEYNKKCAIYLDALDLMQGDKEKIKKSITLFERILDFRDSRAKIKECKENIANLKLISMLE